VVFVILLALVVTAVMFAVGVVPSMASPASSGPVSGTSSDAASVVVQPGDTLWSIAVAAAPHADPRATEQKIIDRNGLRGAEIQAGQVLALPS
jgi:LysM repeat protein